MPLRDLSCECNRQQSQLQTSAQQRGRPNRGQDTGARAIHLSCNNKEMRLDLPRAAFLIFYLFGAASKDGWGIARYGKCVEDRSLQLRNKRGGGYFTEFFSSTENTKEGDQWPR